MLRIEFSCSFFVFSLLTTCRRISVASPALTGFSASSDTHPITFSSTIEAEKTGGYGMVSEDVRYSELPLRFLINQGLNPGIGDRVEWILMEGTSFWSWVATFLMSMLPRSIPERPRRGKMCFFEKINSIWEFIGFQFKDIKYYFWKRNFVISLQKKIKREKSKLTTQQKSAKSRFFKIFWNIKSLKKYNFFRKIHFFIRVFSKYMIRNSKFQNKFFRNF